MGSAPPEDLPIPGNASGSRSIDLVLGQRKSECVYLGVYVSVCISYAAYACIIICCSRLMMILPFQTQTCSDQGWLARAARGAQGEWTYHRCLLVLGLRTHRILTRLDKRRRYASERASGLGRWIDVLSAALFNGKTSPRRRISYAPRPPSSASSLAPRRSRSGSARGKLTEAIRQGQELRKMTAAGDMDVQLTSATPSGSSSSCATSTCRWCAARSPRARRSDH